MAGELIGLTDATGVAVKRRVDRTTGVDEVTNGAESSFMKVDALGRVVSERVREQDKAEKISIYDAAGRVVEVLDADGGLTRITRDAAGRPVRTVSPAGRVNTYEYDTAGRLVVFAASLDTPEKITGSDGVSNWAEPTRWAITRYEYDKNSRVVRRIYPDGGVEETTYDSCGRVTQVRRGARVARYTYNACGHLVMLDDAAYGRRRFAYDSCGRVVRVTDGLGGRTHYTYDADGNVTSKMDATGQTTRYEYDPCGQLTRTIYADGTAHEYSYDAAGRLIRAFNGVRTRQYEYDYAAGGQLSCTRVEGVRVAEYGTKTNSAGGRIMWVRDYATAAELAPSAGDDAFVEHRYVYDRRGLLVERSRTGVSTAEGLEDTPDTAARAEALETFLATGEFTLTFGYDADGYRTTTISPYGASVSVLDGAGRPVRSAGGAGLAQARTALTGTDAGAGVSVYEWDAAGRLARAQVGDIISRWEFDSSGEVSAYRREATAAGGPGAGRVLEDTHLIRDAQGRVVGVETNNVLTMYTYDAAGQVVSARTGNMVYEWEYSAGLMTAEKLYRIADTATDGSASNSKERALLGERSFSYNGLNQLVETTAVEQMPGDGNDSDRGALRTTTAYIYNAAGQRVRQTVTNRRGLHLVREYTWGVYDGLGSVTDTYTTDTPTTNSGWSSRIRLVTDATGEVAEFIGADYSRVPLVWDPTSANPQVLGAGMVTAPGADGGFSQAAVPAGVDPWTIPSAPAGNPYGADDGYLGGMSGSVMVDGVLGSLGFAHAGTGLSASQMDASLFSSSVLPAGLEFTGNGSIRAGGLDVLGARVFETSSRKFLSTDPLEPVAGVAAGVDAYAYANHNPVGFTDPWGLTAVVDIPAYHKYLEHAPERKQQQKTFRQLETLAVSFGIATIPISLPVSGILFVVSAAAGGLATTLDDVDSNGNIKEDAFRYPTYNVLLSSALLIVPGATAKGVEAFLKFLTPRAEQMLLWASLHGTPAASPVARTGTSEVRTLAQKTASEHFALRSATPPPSSTTTIQRISPTDTTLVPRATFSPTAEAGAARGGSRTLPPTQVTPMPSATLQPGTVPKHAVVPRVEMPTPQPTATPRMALSPAAEAGAARGGSRTLPPTQVTPMPSATLQPGTVPKHAVVPRVETPIPQSTLAPKSGAAGIRPGAVKPVEIPSPKQVPVPQAAAGKNGAMKALQTPKTAVAPISQGATTKASESGARLQNPNLGEVQVPQTFKPQNAPSTGRQGSRGHGILNNIAINGITGGATNATAYTLTHIPNIVNGNFETGEFINCTMAGALGNILGGMASPMAGSLARSKIGQKLGITPDGRKQAGLESVFSGGLNTANNEFWESLKDKQEPTTWGDRGYVFGAGVVAPHIGKIPTAPERKVQDIKIAGIKPFAAPEYTSSFRDTNRYHPKLGSPWKGWVHQGANSFVNAGFMAGADLMKIYVDRFFEWLNQSTQPQNGDDGTVPSPSATPSSYTPTPTIVPLPNTPSGTATPVPGAVEPSQELPPTPSPTEVGTPAPTGAASPLTPESTVPAEQAGR